MEGDTEEEALANAREAIRAISPTAAVTTSYFIYCPTDRAHIVAEMMTAAIPFSDPTPYTAERFAPILAANP